MAVPRRPGNPGLAVGLAAAIKFFLWPLDLAGGIGTTSERSDRRDCGRCSLLLVLPFTGLDDYVRSLLELGRIFDQDSYSVRLPRANRGPRRARSRCHARARCEPLLVACWRASLGLAVAAALVLSPIVWLDYYAVAAVPLAAVLPRLSLVWLAPLLTWGLLSAGIGAGNGWGSARVLIVFAIVFTVIVRAERRMESEAGQPHDPATVDTRRPDRIGPSPARARPSGDYDSRDRVSARVLRYLKPESRSRIGIRTAGWRSLQVACFAVLPLLSVVLALANFSEQQRVALDFTTAYRQAGLVVDGISPYVSPDADVSDGSIGAWPIAAILPAVP